MEERPQEETAERRGRRGLSQDEEGAEVEGHRRGMSENEEDAAGRRGRTQDDEGDESKDRRG
jgi:hypothetical protein